MSHDPPRAIPLQQRLDVWPCPVSAWSNILLILGGGCLSHRWGAGGQGHRERRPWRAWLGPGSTLTDHAFC